MEPDSRMWGKSQLENNVTINNIKNNKVIFRGSPGFQRSGAARDYFLLYIEFKGDSGSFCAVYVYGAIQLLCQYFYQHKAEPG